MIPKISAIAQKLRSDERAAVVSTYLGCCFTGNAPVMRCVASSIQRPRETKVPKKISNDDRRLKANIGVNPREGLIN